MKTEKNAMPHRRSAALITFEKWARTVGPRKALRLLWAFEIGRCMHRVLRQFPGGPLAPLAPEDIAQTRQDLLDVLSSLDRLEKLNPDPRPAPARRKR